MATGTLTWLETDPGRVWPSTDGRYAIVAHVLPENPPRMVYQVRKIDLVMAQAHPARRTLRPLNQRAGGLPGCRADPVLHRRTPEMVMHALTGKP